MKKAGLILLLFCFAGIRLGFTQIVVSLPDISGEQGGMANIPISVNPAEGILGASIDFTYSSTVLTKISVMPGDGFTLEEDMSATGVIKFAVKASKSLSGKVNLATVSFKVSGAPGSMSELKFGKVDLSPMPSMGIQTKDGKFTVLSNPDIMLDFLDLNFNNEDNEIEIDSRVLRTVQISNNGSALLEVREIKLIGNTASAFKIESGAENLPRKLSPFSDTLKVAVFCSPTTTGFKDDTLQIFSDDPDENPANVRLMGNAVPKPVIAASQTLIKFPLGTDSAHVSIKNNGGGRLKWRARPSQNWISINPNEGKLRKEDGAVQVSIAVARDGVCERDSVQTIEMSGGSHVDPQTITLNVKIHNPPPIPLLDDDDVEITINDSLKTIPIQLEGVFSDALNDPLQYFLRPDYNSNPAVATAMVSGKTLKITSKSNGITNIMVSASDGCDTTDVTFIVTVNVNAPPDIEHEPVISQDSGKEIRLQATIRNDRDDVLGVTLHHRRSGSRTGFANIRMNRIAPNLYEAVISGSEVTSAGVDYYLSARNMKGRSLSPKPQPKPADSSFYSVRVRVSGQGVAKGSAQPAGNAQIDYRLISMPIDIDNKSASSVLEDDLGKYDNTKWRLFELREDYMDLPSNQKIYKEFPGLSLMIPGKAFWLLVKESGKIIDTGAGISLPTNAVYPLPLHRGWNLIGSPFNFPIDIKKIRIPGQTRVPVRTYQGAWNDPVGNPVNELKPFEGYAVYDSLEGESALLIDPNLTNVSSVQDKALAPNYYESIRYSVGILAQCQDARDIDNVALVSSKAAPNHDPLDQPEPPVIGEYVSVYFPHRDWPAMAKTYCLDARPEPTTGEIWEFEVRTNIRDKVWLTFANLESVPGEFEVWVMDPTLNLSHNLRESDTYVIAGTEHPKRLQLVVGKRGFVAEKRAAVERTPATYELSQNFPNPFLSEAKSRSAGNPSTTIRYGLPKEERVTLAIYNTLGEEVITLFESELQKAGYHVAIWDGRNRAGRIAASGVYIYKLRAGSFTGIKKMALVR
jgi:hypothetical protein